MARLEHPHIVPLYDYWREPDAAYLVQRLFRPREPGRRRARRSARPRCRRPGRQRRRLGAGAGPPPRRRPRRHQAGEHPPRRRRPRLPHRLRASPTDAGAVGAVVRRPAFAAPEQRAGAPATARSDIVQPRRRPGLRPHRPAAGGRPGRVDDASPRPVRRRRARRATSADPAARYGDAESFVRGRAGGAGRARRPRLPRSCRTTRTRACARSRKPTRPTSSDASASSNGCWPASASRARGAASWPIVGPSGSGKSSVVNAGLLPALREGRADRVRRTGSWSR